MLVLGIAGFRAAEPPEPGLREADSLAAGAFCACGCGNHLPGGPRAPVCFGCSVGKADLAYIHEGLASGRTAREILLELADPILVEVFADYGDDGLAATWEWVQEVARELRHHRVVLRTRARFPDSRRAVELAECARLEGSFTSVQRALIHHGGPWDEETLLRLASNEGLAPASMRSCLANVDVRAQLDKDRLHATNRNVRRGPALFVNRKRVRKKSDAALRRAIEAAIRAQSV